MRGPRMKRRVSPDEELTTGLYTERHAVLLRFISRYVRTRSYLLTIGRKVVTNAWRAEQRRPHLVGDDAAVAAVPSADNVDQLVEGWLVAEALERLSPDHQAVVRTLYYEGQSVADAARKLSVPEGTVKSRAYYAVRALRAKFLEMGVPR